MESLLLIGYVYFGYKANMYFRYHFLGQEGLIYFGTFNYILSQIVWAIFFGWVTIPVMLLREGWLMYAKNKSE